MKATVETGVSRRGAGVSWIDRELVSMGVTALTPLVAVVSVIIGWVTGRRKTLAEVDMTAADADKKRAEAEKTRTETHLMAAGLVKDMADVKESMAKQDQLLGQIKSRVIPNHGASLDDKVTRIEAMAAELKESVTGICSTIDALEDSRSSQGHQLGEIHAMIQAEAAQRTASDERIVKMASRQTELLQAQLAEVSKRVK